MGKEWTAEDLAEFAGRGWKVEDANAQVTQLKSGGGEVNVDRPCTAGDGIFVLTQEDRATAEAAGAELLNQSTACSNFIPASGAASRMFAGLRGELAEAVREELENRITEFPFWSDCQRQALKAVAPSDRVNDGVSWMLDPDSGWSHLPKGLIPFHRYADGSSQSSFEEHITEWMKMAGNAPIHFTIPVAHTHRIEQLWEGMGQISTSVQLPETDTLAWDIEAHDVARNTDGSLLLRPGGHGALLHNLNALPGAFITIRNVDNVVPKHRMEFRNQEQRILIGHCARLAGERDALLDRADVNSEHWMAEAKGWLSLFNEHADNIADAAELMRELDRPLRVAGMVLNSGAPGGGPFWIRQADGRSTPSIVEGSELPGGDLSGGTHFNPVDLVCNVQRSDGYRYPLMDFAQRDRFYTGTKDWNGRKVRIVERPGLWNGGMDGWLTCFVEVPAETFAPVKTVMDLLDPERMP